MRRRCRGGRWWPPCGLAAWCRNPTAHSAAAWLACPDASVLSTLWVERGDQGWCELPQGVEHDRGVRESRWLGWVLRAGHGNDAHARGGGGPQAVARVLDRHAFSGRCVEPLGGEQVDVRGWLAGEDLFGRDRDPQRIAQSGGGQRRLDEPRR